VKKLLVLTVASLASFLILYVLVSRDQQARHSGLKTAVLPELIPLHEMFAASDSFPDHSALFGPATTVAWQPGKAAESSFRPRLTIPLDHSIPGPLPTVVLIESGASGTYGPDIAETVRFLVNRGYVVLQIDCRDINTTVEAAGDGIFGTYGSCTETTVLHEAHELIRQGIADPAALAVLGSGTGGTLALSAMSTEPGLFKAAVIHSPTLYQTDHLYTGAVPEQLIKTKVAASIGSAEPLEPSAVLPDKSPIELIESLQGALVLTHGGEAALPFDPDEIRGLKALRRNGVQIFRFRGGGRIYSRWQTRVQVARLTETFLARQLGGRNGGYDYIELLAKLF
tara:strand:+ start:114896 stop:115915 length:1020 start_codon:yes stop_codon:yes gene_type:complete